MFKQTYGFDTEHIKSGAAIKIEDTESTHSDRRSFKVLIHKLDYYRENLAGTYLIQRSSPTEIFVISISGEVLEIPIRHFIGDNPRMKIKILQ